MLTMAPALLTLHHRQHVFQRQEHALQVGSRPGASHAASLISTGPPCGGAADIVDQDIDAAEAIDDRL